MAVVAAKENTFVPGLGGGMIPRNNYTFVRRKPNIVCEEVGAFSYSHYCNANGPINFLCRKLIELEIIPRPQVP